MPADSLSLAPLDSSLPEGAMDACDPSANPNLRAADDRPYGWRGMDLAAVVSGHYGWRARNEGDGELSSNCTKSLWRNCG